MRVLVFGAGSLGSAMGGLLSQKNDVTLLGRRENMDAIRERGLRLSGELDMRAEVNVVESIEEIDEPEIIILATKAYNTKAAVEILERMRWDWSSVVTFQNGLGNLEIIRSWKGPRAFGGTTTMGASLLTPGNVRISGLGTTFVGSDIDPGGANSIAALLAGCGIPTEAKANIVSEIWSKAIVNACINPLTAVLRVKNGALLRSEVITRLMREICDECVQLAGSIGIGLPEGSPLDRVVKVAENTSENRSSMLRDVELGRRTEVGQINGMMCKIGAAKGVPVPFNRALTSMIEALEPLTPGERLIS